MIERKKRTLMIVGNVMLAVAVAYTFRFIGKGHFVRDPGSGSFQVFQYIFLQHTQTSQRQGIQTIWPGREPGFRRFRTLHHTIVSGKAQENSLPGSWEGSKLHQGASPFCASLRCTTRRATAYSTEHRGTAKSMPNRPKALPPRVTAASTQMPGRPTDLPTTRG